MFEYLAVPYSHPDPKTREYRFEMANKIAAKLMSEGRMIYSPISHCHPIAQYGLPKDWEYWKKYDLLFLKMAKRLILVTLDGWRESKGIVKEMEIADFLNIPIAFFDPMLMEITFVMINVEKK